ncbi:MAG: (deoxy)nucleoside triphosphate pyrophosphohydrolase [Acidobacteria bacterium]|nr:(deoxy)nucleoside triphosphate pyrophosphohydrolase [Acidobacteriota bacterium]
MSPHETIRVAAGVIAQDGRYLLTQRAPHTHMAGYWEFPGGKLEPGESPSDALARELREELGIEVDEIVPLWVVLHDYPERRVELNFLRARIASGEPRAQDGVAAYGWYRPDEMPGLPILPADLPLVARLEAIRDE